MVTFDAIRRYGWKCVLLEPGAKRLTRGSTWTPIDDVSVIKAHLAKGGGFGLDVLTSGVVVLDFDAPYDEAVIGVGSFPDTVKSTSPSGGVHLYFDAAGLPQLPAAIEFNGQRLGEILRGPHQQVVLPPSPYPGNAKRGIPAGGEYTWVVPPTKKPEKLPDHWVEYLTVSTLPSYIHEGPMGNPEVESWHGPSAEELLSAALRQVGARRRSLGVKFQCPQCAKEGHDRHRDNAVVLPDGRWGCAYAPGDPAHRRAIAEALGAVAPPVPLALTKEDKEDGEFFKSDTTADLSDF